MKANQTKIQSMTLISLMTAVLCIIGPVTIPLGMIPISAVTAILYLMVYVLGTWKALASCFIYLCIGLIGLPVYSGYSGGAAMLFGPTGGYLIGYLLLIICSGIFIDRFQKIYLQILGMLLGLLACYIPGTLWLAYCAELTLGQAVFTGVVPFVLFDCFKIVIAFIFGPIFRKHLNRAGWSYHKR